MSRKYKAYLEDQHITLCDALEPGRLSRHKPFATVVFLVGILIGVTLLAVLQKCDKYDSPAVSELECCICHAPRLKTYKAYRRYYKISQEQIDNAVILAEIARAQ